MSEVKSSNEDFQAVTPSKATRRDFLQASLAIAGTAAVSSVATTPPAVAQTKQKRPNLVFFFGEGQRADALSIAGHPILKTPNHDRIGREGVRFTNAFCTNALCAPARATALTGMYSRSTGALDNTKGRIPLASDIPLFTEILQKEGYEVAILGKVHTRNGVEERNWDYYFGHNNPSNDYANPLFKEGRRGKVGPQKQYEAVYPDDLTTDRAISWIDEDRGDKPFCVLIWFVAPHEPFFRPRRHADLYNGTPIAKPVTFDDDLKGYPGKPKSFVAAENKLGTTSSHVACGSLEGVAKDYYAGLVAVDENIGRVLDHLEKKKILDDTAILHSSDHGYFLGEWRLFDKRLMHEPSIRVPFQVRYPKRIPSGTVREEMVLDTDIAPTLLDLAGVPIPAHMQGKSILPLTKKNDPEFRKEWYYEYYEWPNPEKVAPHRGIRTEQYKLIQYVLDPTEGELYDLKKDPGERNNLYGASQFTALQSHLTERLNALRAEIPERKEASQS
ncbi:sulfatase/phosphatase domain-containing protein [Terriglobus saanensis]|uniref:Sulfatase n=1 Tax=Terriglobus saanensis (strain ATCC BAA-1853 / DSM 23119 / SP1PR4) TaxID=401053 RepID=E8V2R6_TERSS|nr:sulfatase/phosphatase domain-containing protein [Terriglobus saanensis]ADV83541.1 sulfatase [Terriglobus saanensis SP1PR4]